MAKRGISHDAWMDALRAVEDTTDDREAMTTKELSVYWRCSAQCATRRIEKIVAAGLAVETRKRTTRGSAQAFRLTGGK